MCTYTHKLTYLHFTCKHLCIHTYVNSYIYVCVWLLGWTVLQHTATHCSALQRTAALQHWFAASKFGLLSMYRPYKLLHHAATQCNTLQLTATHCNIRWDCYQCWVIINYCRLSSHALKRVLCTRLLHGGLPYISRRYVYTHTYIYILPFILASPHATQCVPSTGLLHSYKGFPSTSDVGTYTHVSIFSWILPWYVYVSPYIYIYIYIYTYKCVCIQICNTYIWM